MYHVYILKSGKDNWYYVGSTNNLDRRIQEHNLGKVQSTKSHRPLILVYKEEYAKEDKARSREFEIKKRRIVKEQIIKNIDKSGFLSA
jgi:putative endonuclease